MGQARFTVVGAGALGMLFAAKLGLSGSQVELCARRPSHIHLLHETGIRLRSAVEGTAEGVATIRPEVRTLEQSVFAGESEMDLHYIVLAVKQAAITPEFVRQIRRGMGTESWVVCLQNGIGHIEALSLHVPKGRIIAAVTTEGAMKAADNEVVHTGQGTTWIGTVAAEREDQAEHAQKKLAERLNLAGFRVFLSKDITSRVWQKLIINSVINPLTAVLRLRNGELLQRPQALELMRALFDEAAEAAGRLQLSLDPDLWDQLLEVCRKTAGNRSSMLQDLLLGRTTEIEFITGGILREAEKAGLALPVHQTVYWLVKAMEAGTEAGGRT